jgi:transcriptional regulator with PAS, ATPase and Fis domain
MPAQVPRPRHVAAELVSLLEGLSGARVLVDRQYRVLAANRAYREQYGGRTEIVGRRCHEISHGYAQPCHLNGEPCPLQAALVSGQTERVMHVHQTPRGEEVVQVELIPMAGTNGQTHLFIERMDPLPTLRSIAADQPMVGRAPAFVRMLDQLARVAASDTSVLLLGETGTGKEMVARAIHAGSRRAHSPFVVVDCSGMPETLFESELFGHERGAFTGALARKTGLVESAAGGTLFLDELGDIPLGLQVKLLRLIETGSFRRVGGIESQHADFRLIGATHRDLPRMVRDERFRADLFYRISAFPIRLPALRERREDLPLLTGSLLTRLQPDRRLRLTPDALRLLQGHDFPGNVRELRNLLERACLLADGERIEPRHLLGDSLQFRPAPSPPVVEAVPPLVQAERDALASAVRAHKGSRRELARSLGLSERSLYRRLRKFGLGR